MMYLGLILEYADDNETSVTLPVSHCEPRGSYCFYLVLKQDAELLVNVTEHFLVPVHQVLTDEEKKSLLERYTLRESQVGT